LHVVLSGKRHIIGVENVADELEYDHFDDIPSFSIGIDPVPVDDGAERIYAQTYHEDGLWFKKKLKKKKKMEYKFLSQQIEFKFVIYNFMQ
jgi:hypothetical protein